MTDVAAYANDTQKSEEVYTRSLPLIIVGSIVILLTAITAIVGNFGVVATNIMDETLKAQSGNMLVSNLALLDMFTGMFVMVPCALSVIFDRWVLGDFVCSLHMCFNYMCASGSSVNLALISVDRAIAVLYPLHYPQWITPVVMRVMCTYVWIHGTVVGSIGIFLDWSTYGYNEAMCSVRWDNEEDIKLFMTVCMVLCFIIPLTIVLVCNFMIIISARKMEKSSVAPQSKPDATRKAKESATKTVKSMVVVTALYFICFTPYSSIKQAKAVIGNIENVNWIDFVTTIIMFFSSAVNPFVYAILRKDYRNAFKKLPRMLKDRIYNM